MATPAEELDVDGTAVRLSNPDKIYFPRLGADGGTKRHLVEYYRTIATLDGNPLVRALRDRPTYLQRFPDGIEGEEVYQKRLPPKVPEHVRSCRVTFPSGRHADALRVTNPADVVWAANLGCVTFHPWHATCFDVEHPDQLRVDLDPQPGTGFRDAAGVAVEVVRPLLDELGFAGYPKTSGGRGVHVFVAIEPRWTFTQVRRAAIALAREIERRSGGRVTTAWWKEQRGEQVFVDYNQNARDRTIASAYSARRTPTATVSTPVAWTSSPTPIPTTSPSPPFRRSSPGGAIPWRRSARSGTTSKRCSSSPIGTRPVASATSRIRRTTPRCRGNRSGSCRAGHGPTRPASPHRSGRACRTSTEPGQAAG